MPCLILSAPQQPGHGDCSFQQIFGLDTVRLAFLLPQCVAVPLAQASLADGCHRTLPPQHGKGTRPWGPTTEWRTVPRVPSSSTGFLLPLWTAFLQCLVQKTAKLTWVRGSVVVKEQRFWGQAALLQILALLFISCMTLSKFLNLSVPLDPSLVTDLLGHKVRGCLWSS